MRQALTLFAERGTRLGGSHQDGGLLFGVVGFGEGRFDIRLFLHGSRGFLRRRRLFLFFLLQTGAFLAERGAHFGRFDEDGGLLLRVVFGRESGGIFDAFGALGRRSGDGFGRRLFLLFLFGGEAGALFAESDTGSGGGNEDGGLAGTVVVTGESRFVVGDFRRGLCGALLLNGRGHGGAGEFVFAAFLLGERDDQLAGDHEAGDGLDNLIVAELGAIGAGIGDLAA